MLGRKFTIFALFYFVLEGKFQVRARGAYIRRGNLTEDSLGDDFGGLIFGGAYGMFSTCIILQSVSNSLQSAVCKCHTPSHDRVLGYCYE